MSSCGANLQELSGEQNGCLRLVNQLIVESEGLQTTSKLAAAAAGQQTSPSSPPPPPPPNASNLNLLENEAHFEKRNTFAQNSDSKSNLSPTESAIASATTVTSSPSPARQFAPRSASTCGALESYANSKAFHQKTAATCAAPTNLYRRDRDQSASNCSITVATNAPLCDNRRHADGWPSDEQPFASVASLTANDYRLASKRASEATATNIPSIAPSRRVGRSFGGGTSLPLQIVKVQATPRQLNQNETTTRLLIVVITVFLICELPAGVMALLCALLGSEFFENVYLPLGFVTDLLALISSAVNFILYCLMSTQFRITFYRVVLHCPAPTAKPQQNHNKRQALNEQPLNHFQNFNKCVGNNEQH